MVQRKIRQWNEPWTHAEIDKVRKLAGRGLQAFEIAQRLPRRNAASVRNLAKRVNITVQAVSNKKWSDEAEDIVRKHWGKGPSASDIARMIGGGVSRNAVIGKAHRLDLKTSAKPGNSTRQPQNRWKPKPRPPARPVPKSIPLEASDPIGLLELTETTCKWPVDTEDGMKYCGLPSLGVRPYCPHHNDIAYVPNTKRVR